MAKNRNISKTDIVVEKIMKKEIIICDKCKAKQETGKEFWATVNCKSSIYLFDDGTREEDLTWHLCRKCKIDLFGWIDKKQNSFAKSAKQ